MTADSLIDSRAMASGQPERVLLLQAQSAA